MGEVAASLRDMGFSEEQIQYGLKKTGSKQLETVLNWIITNPEGHLSEPGAGTPSAAPQGHVLGAPPSAAAASSDGAGAVAASGESNEPPAVAQSLKCEDCGKLLRSPVEAEAHAVRSGHSNFSESTEQIKPLTEEEKKQKLAELQEKMKQKRLEKEEQEKREQIERERSRRKDGRQVTQLKEDVQMKEARLAAEERRREKEADRLAREKVKAEIAKDREDKRRRAEQATAAAAATPATSDISAAAAAPKPPTNYTETKIQIRLKGGQPLVQSFSVNEQLSAVKLYVQLHSPSPLSPGFTLMTTFPKKIFTPADMDTPLKQLGLVPSAVLAVHDP